MRRSLSSCLETTRMWRRTERASLEKKPLDQVEPGAMLGSEGEVEPPSGLLGEPSSRLPGDMRGMIVEDQMDRGVGRVRRIEELEELDELTAAVTISDQGVHLARQQVDASKQADRAVALVFVVACEGCMQAGFGRQIGCRRCDPLDTRLLIVGDYGYCIGWFCLRPGCGLLQQLHFAINAEHFGHLFRKLGVAALQVIPDFMRLHLLLVEDLAHSALRQMGETRVPLRRSMLASVTGQKPRCPQFVRIAQIHSPSGTPAIPTMPWLRW